MRISQPSRAGFGCYRVRNTKEHFEAVTEALARGCTLFDTASTYTGGESEQLLGNALTQHPEYTPFIISKAGYLNDHDLIPRLLERGVAAAEIITFGHQYRHCMHPVYLDLQLNTSLKRINRPTLGAYLIHNPEYFFSDLTGDKNPDEYYARIKKAFEFLEEAVRQGRISCYGISSNTFPFPTSQPNTTNLNRCLRLAAEVSSSHHFSIIQFPFNLFERDASLLHHDGESILTIARNNGITTIANRPFNCNNGERTVRLAVSESKNFNEQENRETVLGLKEQIALKDDAKKILEGFFLHYNKITDLQHLESVRQFVLTNAVNVAGDAHKIETLFTAIHEQARKNISDNTLRIKEQLVASGLLQENDAQPFAAQLCALYLNSGLNHVLAGMRKKEYVNDLSTLF